MIRSLRHRLNPSLYISSFSTLSSSSSAAAVQADRTIKEGPRNNWTKDEIKHVYDSPFLIFSTLEHKSIDMLTISGKCSNAPFSLLKLEGVVRIVHTVHNLPGVFSKLFSERHVGIELPMLYSQSAIRTSVYENLFEFDDNIGGGDDCGGGI